MRLLSILLLLATSSALAQDDVIDPMDIELDIDIGPAVETFTYEGGYTQRSSAKVTSEAAISVSSTIGTTVVYCTDTEFVEARVAYVVEGTDKGPMESYGNSIRLATWGEAGSGGSKLVAGSKPSAVKAAKVELIVNVPKKAKLTVNSSGSWVQVNGCDGRVSVTAARDGVYVDGALQSFAVSAGSGNAKVVLKDDAKLTGTSSLTAGKGDATLVMALGQNVKLDARGGTVNVTHNVIGNVAAASVAGSMGSGGPGLTVRASGAVTITTP